MSRLHWLVLTVVIAACGKSEPEWLTNLKPKMQAALDAHAKQLAAVAPLVAAGEPIPCTETIAGIVPSLTQPTLTKLAAGTTSALTWTPKTSDFLASKAYLSLVGGDWTVTPEYIDPAIAQLAGAKAIGVFVEKSFDEGKIDGRSILKPASYAGTFVLIKLEVAPKLIGRVEVSAKSNDFVISGTETPLQALRGSLESNVRKAAMAACPGITL